MGRALVATLLAVLVVATGVLTWTSAREVEGASDSSYNVVFREEETTLQLPATSRNGPGELRLDALIDPLNITRMRFDLDISWNTPRPNAISIEVSFRDPEGKFENTSWVSPGIPSMSESTFHEFVYRQLPPSTDLKAPDGDAASKSTHGRYASTKGTGNWTIVLTIPTSTYDTPTPPTYSLSGAVTVFSFEARLTPVSAT